MTGMDHADRPAALRSMSGAQPLVAYVQDLWRRRQFTMSLATGSLRAQHLDTTLGGLWHVLNPALSMAVYFLVFGVILGTDRGIDNFIGFLAVGIFTFTYMQRTISACGDSIANNIGLIRSLQFPRAVLPVSTVIRELYGYGFAALVMIVVLLATGERPHVTWLGVPVLIVSMTLFCGGLGMILARLADQVRDVSQVVPYIFRIIFYLSGIIFSIQSFIDERAATRLSIGLTAPQIRHIFVLDPFYTYIALLRHTLMQSYDMEHVRDAWIVALLAGPITFIAGLLFFRNGERRYGRG
jgi:teichoic acid transport system permease protein